MSKPKKIGEGSYGCVHNPPLKCKDKPYDSDRNKVSKILTREDADKELKEFKLIKKADKKEDFHLGKPDDCLPDNNKENLSAIKSCKHFHGDWVRWYKLLLLKNGGQDLTEIEKKFGSLPVTNANRRKLENFWLDMSRIIYGVKVLVDNGIVHHDLKQQNIVYKKETGRVNFIDFGLMTTIDKMQKKSERSNTHKTVSNKGHWSYPPEVILYNYNKYNRLTTKIEKDKKKFTTSLFASYFSETLKFISYDLKDYTENITTFRNRVTADLYEMCFDLKKPATEYNKFLNKSFETFDNYAIGFSLFSILKKTFYLINDRLYNDLRLLFLSMVNFNIFKRPSATQVVEKYEYILKSNGLLDKYNMRFENHFLVDGSEKKEQEKKIEELNISKIIDELIIKCPVGKEINPKTNRCINKCKDDYSRDDAFKCKKNKTQKKIIEPIKSIKNKTQKKKECPEGKELNPKTNRCNNECKSGYSRDADFKCKPIHKLILEGHRRNPLRDV